MYHIVISAYRSRKLIESYFLKGKCKQAYVPDEKMPILFAYKDKPTRAVIRMLLARTKLSDTGLSYLTAAKTGHCSLIITIYKNGVFCESPTQQYIMENYVYGVKHVN